MSRVLVAEKEREGPALRHLPLHTKVQHGSRAAQLRHSDVRGRVRYAVSQRFGKKCATGFTDLTAGGRQQGMRVLGIVSGETVILLVNLLMAKVYVSSCKETILWIAFGTPRGILTLESELRPLAK